MADFGGLGGETDVEAGEGPPTTAQAPVIRTGLLSPSIFPLVSPGGSQADGPAIAPQPPLLSGPLDPDVHAEVLQDILDAQAKLAPLAPAQGPGDAATWDGGRLDPPAPLITGSLDTDTHAKVLRDIQNAQARLPPLSLRSASFLGNGTPSNISNSSSSDGLRNDGPSGDGGHAISVPGIEDSAAGNSFESLPDRNIGIRLPGIDTDASGFGFEALSNPSASPATSSVARGSSGPSPTPITYQLVYNDRSAGQIPSLFSTSAGDVHLPEFTADHRLQLNTDGPALVERDGHQFVWAETPKGTQLAPYVTVSATSGSNRLSPGDRLGLLLGNPVSAIVSTIAGLAGARPPTQDAILAGGSAIETPLYAVGSSGRFTAARPTDDLVPEVRQLGGAHREVRGLSGYEAHHMPANSISPLSIGEGPSLAMLSEDHWLTESWGNSPAAQAYRQAQANLIAQGNFQAAQDMDVADVRSKFGRKYDAGIQQMLNYSRSKGYRQ